MSGQAKLNLRVIPLIKGVNMKRLPIISISLITILSCSMASIYSNKTQLFDLNSKLKNNLLGYWNFARKD